MLRQRIYDRDTDAVQTAANLIRVIVKLTAGMQYRHDDLRCGAPFFRVHVHGNATAIIAYRDGFVGVDRYGNGVAMACESLVDRVIDDLENHVVETGAIIGVADIHSWPLSDGLQAL